AGVAVAAAALAPMRSRAPRAPVAPVVDATAARQTPIPAATLAAERAQVRAAQDAARRLGDERIAALAGDLDQTLRRLASGALDDGTALELLHMLEAKAGEAARAAGQARRAGGAGADGVRGSV